MFDKQEPNEVSPGYAVCEKFALKFRSRVSQTVTYTLNRVKSMHVPMSFSATYSPLVNGCNRIGVMSNFSLPSVVPVVAISTLLSALK